MRNPPCNHRIHNVDVGHFLILDGRIFSVKSIIIEHADEMRAMIELSSRVTDPEQLGAPEHIITANVGSRAAVLKPHQIPTNLPPT